MKINELIKELEEIKEEVGDVDVVMLTDTEAGDFCFDFDFKIDIIQIPFEGKLESPVAAIAWKSCFEEEEEEIKNHLKIEK